MPPATRLRRRWRWNVGRAGARDRGVTEAARDAGRGQRSPDRGGAHAADRRDARNDEPRPSWDERRTQRLWSRPSILSCRGYDRAKDRKWRHVDAAGMTMYLRYRTRRVRCG